MEKAGIRPPEFPGPSGVQVPILATGGAPAGARLGDIKENISVPLNIANGRNLAGTNRLALYTLLVTVE
jgi:hypothetical protein